MLYMVCLFKCAYCNRDYQMNACTKIKGIILSNYKSKHENN